MQWESGKEKRRFIRTDFPYTVIIICQDKEPISTYTENISAVGIKVTTRDQLDHAALVSLEIYVDENPIKCRGKVVWCHSRESDCLEDTVVFDSGIEFCEILEKDKFFINQCVEKNLKENPSSESEA